MVIDQKALRAVWFIAASRARKSVRLLDAIYGPAAQGLRAEVASVLRGTTVAKSAPAAQYGKLRTALLDALEIKRDCTATEDANFESVAEGLLSAAK